MKFIGYIFRFFRVAFRILLITVVALGFLFYLPPVQSWLGEFVCGQIEKTTGISVRLQKLRITFPFDLRLEGIEADPDLLRAAYIVVDLNFGQILGGNIGADEIALGKVEMHTSDMIDGMVLDGKLDKLSIKAKRWDTSRKTLLVNDFLLKGADISCFLRDTAEAKTDTAPPFLNKIRLLKGEMADVRVNVRMPDAGMDLMAKIGKLDLKRGKIDLRRNMYALNRLDMQSADLHLSMENPSESGPQSDSTRVELKDAGIHLQGVSVSLDKMNYSVDKLGFVAGGLQYHQNGKTPAKGLDPEHLRFSSLSMVGDSVRIAGTEYAAVLEKMQWKEASGLKMESLSGRVSIDSLGRVEAGLTGRTPYSELQLSGTLPAFFPDSVAPDAVTKLKVALRIGKRDLMCLGDLLPAEGNRWIPEQGVVLGGTLSGKGEKLMMQRLDLVSPGNLSANVVGTYNLRNQSFKANLKAKGENLDFLAAMLADNPKEMQNGVRFPKGLELESEIAGVGTSYKTHSTLRDANSIVGLVAAYDTKTERYAVDLNIDSLLVNHFYPIDSVRDVTAAVQLKGKGIDLFSPRSSLDGKMEIRRIGFNNGYIRFINMDVSLQKSLLKARLSADNRLIGMNGELSALLRDRKYPTASAFLDIYRADLQKIGVLRDSLSVPFALTLNAVLERQKTQIEMHTGDLSLKLNGEAHYSALIDQTMQCADLLQEHINTRKFDHLQIKRNLPMMQLAFDAGKQNVFQQWLKENTGLAFIHSRLNLNLSTADGISGDGLCYGLQTADVMLDTLLLQAQQDTSELRLNTTLINGPKNPLYSFRSQIQTIIRGGDGEINLRMLDKNQEVGAEFGIRGKMMEEGFSFSLFPENPILAYRRMKLNRDNEIRIGNDGSLFADLILQEADGGASSISIQSNDSLIGVKRDVMIDIKKINVDDIVRSMPFLPDVGGVFSGTLQIKEEKKLRFILNSQLEQGKYNGMSLGDLTFRAGYMPDSIFDHHTIGAQLARNGQRIVSVGGKYSSETSELLQSQVLLHGVPLNLFNGFIPDLNTNLSGKLEGKITAKGQVDKLSINGNLHFDSTYIQIPDANLKLRLDSKDITIEDNVLNFKDYHIYAAGQEPFTIGGTISYKDFSAMPIADLSLTAKNYRLIDQRTRTKGTLLLGRLVVNLNSTMQGAVDNLKMRGNMHILGATDLTYIMENSPLTVQDRLSEELTFVNFSDTLSSGLGTDSLSAMGVYRPSSMDILLRLSLDPTVHFRAELTADGNSYVDLQGGGDLVLKSTPLSDMSLTGKYTLTGGTMKYAFSMIPLKEFSLQEGSFVQWNGALMNPTLHLTAVETVRSTVTDSDNRSRGVNFDISIKLTNTLENLGVSFDIEAPQDAAMQEELSSLTAEERSKQAITTLATGVYTVGANSGGMKVSDALNTLLQSQINSLAGNVLKSTDLSIGMSSYRSEGDVDGSGRNTDYSYKFARRFWNNRVRVVVGGTISQGDNAADQGESFIDNISIEYNFNNAGTRSVRIYHNKNYESILEGEIIETGVGYIYRKKFNRLMELLPWYKYRAKKKQATSVQEKEKAPSSGQTKSVMP